MAKTEGIKILTDNRKARHEYALLDRFEAGMVLTGPEVKSARNGKIQLVDGYASVKNNEVWLHKVHISPYFEAGRENPDSARRRKLLLHRKEIDRLIGKTREQGLTLIPTKVYLKNGLIKCEIALAKGKKIHDKRETLRRRDAEEEARNAIGRRG